jgi:hypothetical protein
MTTSQKIIAEIERLGATPNAIPKIIGYFTALQTCGHITFPVELDDLLTPDAKTPSAEQKDRAPRNRTSKAAQAIAALFVPGGITVRAIVTATGYPAEKVKATLTAMQKSRTAYVKNSRWFGGPAPAKAAKRKTTASKSTGDISLNDASLRAVEAAQEEGAGASDVLNYLSRELGMTVRPNHLGIALQRHRRAGRLVTRNDRWYTPNVEELRRAS